MKTILCFILIGILYGCASPEKGKNLQMDKVHQGHAVLTSPGNQNLDANVQVIQSDKGIKILTRVEGLKPNSVHGFHIHENGKCEGPDFKTAGGHLNPAKHNHSSPENEMRHLGDLGNLVANKEGVAVSEVLISHGNEVKMDEILGKAMIIHAKPDDLTSQPAGDAGDRIACGLIQQGALAN